MLTNYLKIAWRNLWRNKLFSFVNIVGLALSMAVGIGLLMGLKDNFDTDHFHPHPDRTYRILTDASTSEGQTRWATTPQPLADAIRDISSVEAIVQVRRGGAVRVLSDPGEPPVEVTFTEPAFFEVFGFIVSAGDAAKALQSPDAVLLSRPTAQRLFGDKNPVGQAIQLDGLGFFTVAGLIEKPALRTHLPLEVVLSLRAARSLEKAGKIPTLTDQWSDYKTTATYALLRTGADGTLFNRELGRLGRKGGPAEGERLAFLAQPIEDITPWDPAIRNDLHAGMNWSGISTNVFLLLAFTLLAAFNYTTLSLARALTRAHEVGIRKASGAVSRQIYGQFLTEATLVALFALVLAFWLFYTVINSGWLPESTRIVTLPGAPLAGWLLLYALLTGLVAGAVPAGLLARFQPVQVLRDLKTLRLFRSVGFYRILIVIQFAVTIMFMVFVVVLRDAGHNMADRLSGQLPTNVVLVSLRGEPATTLQYQIEQLSQVKRVTVASQMPFGWSAAKCSLRVADAAPLSLAWKRIDPNYVSVFGLTMRAGRNLPDDIVPTQERFVLLNEAAARLLPGHTPEKAIGQTLRLDSTDVQVAGILADPAGLVGTPQPTVYRYLPQQTLLMAVQTEAGSATAVAEACRRIWQKNVPERLPEVFVYDQKISDEMEASFRPLNSFFGFFCALVMAVACLGILGVSAYSVEVRTREISIRRTLGAGSAQVIWTLSKTFLKLLLWAGLIGLPAGWFCGKLLRERLVDAVDLGPGNLLLGFGLVVLVGLATVLSQTVRAIWVNPADVLRRE